MKKRLIFLSAVGISMFLFTACAAGSAGSAGTHGTSGTQSVAQVIQSRMEETDAGTQAGNTLDTDSGTSQADGTDATLAGTSAPTEGTGKNGDASDNLSSEGTGKNGDASDNQSSEGTGKNGDTSDELSSEGTDKNEDASSNLSDGSESDSPAGNEAENGAAGMDTPDAGTDSETTTESGSKASVEYLPENIDVDLTVMSSQLVYSEVYNMMCRPDDYIGKVVKMEGSYSYYYDEGTDTEYHACIIQDATACCSQGMEFVPTDEYTYPDDFPRVGEDVTVVGVFDIYYEADFIFMTLRNAVLLDRN